MANDQQTTSEAAILHYCAEHPDAVSGARYHTSKARSAQWVSEKRIPVLLKAFDPATLAAEIERRAHGGSRSSPAASTKRPEDGNSLATWYVGKLFDLADDREAPATARLTAVQRIRSLMAECLKALHEPLRDAVGSNDQGGPDHQPAKSESPYVRALHEQDRHVG